MTCRGRGIRLTFVLWLVLIAVPIVAAQSGPSPVPHPELTGPITGGSRGQAFGAMSAADRAAAGYTEDEYFIAGTANAYVKDGNWDRDGRWNVTPGTSAGYRVRMLVRRPADPKRFNGVLIVEWLNVSSLQEGAADYLQMKEEIERSGYAWVGVGAQSSGINAPRTGLKAWDPARYEPLSHPGDAYSYDIFSQAVQEVVRAKGTGPLGGLAVRQTLATGRSQSAFRLVTYINAFHRRTGLFDGFLVHSRGANAAGLTAEQLAADPTPVPAGAHIRSDLDVPVLDVQAEGDIVALRAHLTHQPPSARYRRWEIAGAAHAENPRWVFEVPPPPDMGQGCLEPINSAPHHAVVKAALHALTRWVRDGVAPPQSPAIELTDPAAADPIARDAFGNARGGIRLPQIVVPTATLDGRRNDVAKPTPGGPNFCFLFGHTVPFEAARLASLYPTHEAFVRQFNAAVDAIEQAGYWLKPEADAARAAAAHSAIGR